MKRKAFKMTLYTGRAAEYKKRHDQIWPELSKELSEAGIYDFSIYLDEDNLTLFAFQKLKINNTADHLPDSPIMRKWWNFMADIMDTNPDNSPVMTELKEVFHMD